MEHTIAVMYALFTVDPDSKDTGIRKRISNAQSIEILTWNVKLTNTIYVRE